MRNFILNVCQSEYIIDKKIENIVISTESIYQDDILFIDY